jgi:hypothetical protein
MRPARAATAAGLLIALALSAGCSSDERADVCPRVAVLSEAGTLTRFAPGSGRDILDIDFQAQVGDLLARCTFPDVKGKRQVVVQLAPVFVVSRGAANADGKASFTYFVSVVRTEQILSKQQFEVVVEFPGNRSRIAVQDDDPPIVIDIPLPYRKAEYEYEVLVGFQLTAEELEDNRRWQSLGR